MTPEEKRIRHRDAQRKYRAAHTDKCRETVRESLRRYRANMTQIQKDKRRLYMQKWREARKEGMVMARRFDARRLPRGTETVGTCRTCGNEFTYVYLTKARISCDLCQGIGHGVRNHDRYHNSIKTTRHGMQCPHHRDTKGLGAKPQVQRKQWMTKHDLQWSPTDDFARRVNAILNGERGLV